TPGAPRIAASTVASEGRTVHTASAARATSPADFAGVPPRAARRSRVAGTTSKPTTACPAARSRDAIASPSSPTPTMPTFMRWGPRNGPQAPSHSGRPGKPGAPLESRSAMLAWGIVPRVGGGLEVLVGLVGPELGDVGEGVDDGV